MAQSPSIWDKYVIEQDKNKLYESIRKSMFHSLDRHKTQQKQII